MSTKLKDLIGLTMSEVKNIDNQEILFVSAEGRRFRLFHNQDCCETVEVEEIAGDLDFLVGSPILMAEESSCNKPDAYDSGTWTFYLFATLKGYVTIRWLGESNGYYSEAVDFEEVGEPN